MSETDVRIQRCIICYIVTTRMTTLSRVLRSEGKVAVLSRELSHFWSTLLYFLFVTNSLHAGWILPHNQALPPCTLFEITVIVPVQMDAALNTGNSSLDTDLSIGPVFHLLEGQQEFLSYLQGEAVRMLHLCQSPCPFPSPTLDPIAPYLLTSSDKSGTQPKKKGWTVLAF